MKSAWGVVGIVSQFSWNLAGLFYLAYNVSDKTMVKERPLPGATKKKVSEDKVSKNEGRHKKHKRHSVKHQDTDDESSKVGLKSPKLAARNCAGSPSALSIEE